MSSEKNNGLLVNTFVGDRAVLLTFDLEESKTSGLAGFTIKCVTPDKGPFKTNEYYLKNMLNFKDELTSKKQIDPKKQHGSDKAPFQTFHWIHFPSAGPGRYQYTISGSYFKNDGNLELGPHVSVDLDLSDESMTGFELGFTRGYVSSQAYAERFQNKAIRPSKMSINFKTRPYLKQYEWLGAHARKLIFDFLNECQSDASIHLDVFAFDFNEPDIIGKLSMMAPRVRLFLDNAATKSLDHKSADSIETQAADELEKKGAEVHRGHFSRFAHDKVMIQIRNDKPVKVLTGSANFSIRGLYVQANSVLVCKMQEIADLYEKAFQQGFTGEKDFKLSKIASKWYDVPKNGLDSVLSFSFAPHKTDFTLDKVADSINSAKSSVLFAVMEMGGAGRVIQALKDLGDRKELFSLGTIQHEKQLQLFKPGIDANSAVTNFKFLSKNVAAPFRKEVSGGSGQVIHHKFVVCDFNGQSPIVFCGSSNLSAGGETANGDNLIAISDSRIPTYYAVEAIRLYDHYRFRSLHEHATSNNPLVLKSTDEWTKPYYDPKDIKFRERQLFTKSA